ncbi:MAG TPA: pyridoxamine 5'-phosphate oxidase family protein [Candidatus Dormibacteraeota bacterium]|nr:pyridoxamine 5'-phosphate oxidase family protein [Candidatus Dormibacteraeota bacterium]
MHLERDEAMRRAVAADHGVLATLNRTGAPDLVPACFAIVDGWLVIPIDAIKPKGSTALGRTRNLERDPRATLLLEHWDPVDWSRLWWVRLGLVRADPGAGLASRLELALRSRYPQYATTTFASMLAFRVETIRGWEAR